MRLTQQTVAKLRPAPAENDRDYFDDKLPGFGVRVRHGGSLTWFVRYRKDGAQRRVVLGKVGVVDADKAREKAKDILAQVQLGEDPQQQRTDDGERDKLTLAIASKEYLSWLKPQVSPDYYAQVERFFNLHWAPLKHRPVHKIDRKEVSARLRVLSDPAKLAAEDEPDGQFRGGPVASNRARDTLSAFFSWAMDADLVDRNPVVGSGKNKEYARDNVLEDDELKAVWKACGDDDFGRIVRLLILTGQRREEIAGAYRSEIQQVQYNNLQSEMVQIWALSLPAERSKNRKPHIVPLCDAARALLSPRPVGGDVGETRELIFGRGDGPFSGWTRCKERLEKRSGVTDWVIHDLRRSAATGMARIGIPPHIIEAVLNHVSEATRGVAGIYNRHAYLDEKRDALSKWAAHIENLVKDNVLEFPALAKVA